MSVGVCAALFLDAASLEGSLRKHRHIASQSFASVSSVCTTQLDRVSATASPSFIPSIASSLKCSTFLEYVARSNLCNACVLEVYIWHAFVHCMLSVVC